MASGGLAMAGLPSCRQTSRLSPGYARLLIQPNEDTISDLSGHFQDRSFTVDTPFRVASISKIMTAELARRLNTDQRLRLDEDVTELLGFSLRHPEWPREPITIRQLLSHQSGIKDPAIYWVAAPGNIRTLLTDEIWERGVKPGKGFRYSNLNYGLAATIIEAATRDRFDRLFTAYVARPLGLDIGFNWSGVSAGKRRSAFPCLRGQSGSWDVQVDGFDMLQGTDPIILKEPGFQLDDYVPGTNGTLFSPQGGLRASVRDLAIIGQTILLDQPDLHKPSWIADRFDPGSNSEAIAGRPSEQGHFVAFGDGVYIYPNGPFGQSGRRWVGHHGEAYGFYGGLWVRPDDGTIVVYADLGSPDAGSPLTGGWPNQTEIATDAFQWAQHRDKSRS